MFKKTQCAVKQQTGGDANENVVRHRAELRCDWTLHEIAREQTWRSLSSMVAREIRMRGTFPTFIRCEKCLTTTTAFNVCEWSAARITRRSFEFELRAQAPLVSARVIRTTTIGLIVRAGAQVSTLPSSSAQVYFFLGLLAPLNNEQNTPSDGRVSLFLALQEYCA